MSRPITIFRRRWRRLELLRRPNGGRFNGNLLIDLKSSQQSAVNSVKWTRR